MKMSRVLAGLLGAICIPGLTLANTLHLTDDTFINFGQTNGNKGDRLEVTVRDSANERRGFARFDLSTLPIATTAADIDSATLRLWVKERKQRGWSS